MFALATRHARNASELLIVNGSLEKLLSEHVVFWSALSSPNAQFPFFKTDVCNLNLAQWTQGAMQLTIRGAFTMAAKRKCDMPVEPVAACISQYKDLDSFLGVPALSWSPHSTYSALRHTKKKSNSPRLYM